MEQGTDEVQMAKKKAEPPFLRQSGYLVKTRIFGPLAFDRFGFSF